VRRSQVIKPLAVLEDAVMNKIMRTIILYVSNNNPRSKRNELRPRENEAEARNEKRCHEDGRQQRKDES
jgi:hypothetical protein